MKKNYQTLNDIPFNELPVGLQQRLDEQVSDETGYIPQTMICPVCFSVEINHWDTTDMGEFVYSCDDCESVFGENEIVIE
jgi:Zn-finger protein